MQSVLDKLSRDPDRKAFLSNYSPGQKVFLEGDQRRDLYILVSGEMEVIKGKIVISQISEPGTIFGEMAYLLGTNRTATVKANTKAKAYAIPEEQVGSFFEDYPEISQKINRTLARRLAETSHVAYGLKEFSDQIPDALILTNRQGEIVSWNSAAEDLYGQTWHQVGKKPASEIHKDPQAYRDLLKEVQSGHRVQDKVLAIKHPQKGARHVSLSMTRLYDGYNNYQGVLALGRDVTAQVLKRKYRTIRYLIVAGLLAVLALVALGAYLGYPIFPQSPQTIDAKKMEFKNSLAKDFLLLRSLLMDEMDQGRKRVINRILKKFFEGQGDGKGPYRGLILLDPNKQVLAAYSADGQDKALESAGTTYAHIDLRPHEGSSHRMLTLYRVGKDRAASQRHLEAAFEIEKDGNLLGWIIFQMNEPKLAQKYGVLESDLKSFQIQSP